MAEKNIFIESGHGKKKLAFGLTLNDPGAVRSINGFQWTERNLTVGFGNIVLGDLQGKVDFLQGVGVHTSATIQQKVAYVNEVIRKNGLKPDDCLYVAIHVNAGGGKGAEIYHKSWKNVQISREKAISILQKYRAWTGIHQHGKGVFASRENHYGRLYIDDLIIPACLIEVGYIDSTDLEILKDTKKVGDAIASAILHS